MWHHICVSWENSLGSWKFYKDGDLKKDGKDLKKGYTIKEGGALVLGQDQDSVGGGFETADSFRGMLSNVNVWGYVLSATDIKSSRSCLLDVGNVYRWPDFLHEGGTRLVQQSPCKREGFGMWRLILPQWKMYNTVQVRNFKGMGFYNIFVFVHSSSKMEN